MPHGRAAGADRAGTQRVPARPAPGAQRRAAQRRRPEPRRESGVADQGALFGIMERAAKDGAETVGRVQGFARIEHDTPMTEVRLDMLARDAIDLTRPRWRDVAQSRGTSIEIVRNLKAVT